MGLIRAAILRNLRLTRKRIAKLGSPVQHAAGFPELLHRHLWLHGGGVERGLVLDALVDWNGGVHDGWLDDLALDHGLHFLVDVVVDVFAADCAGGDFVAGGGEYGSGRLELLCLRQCQ
jgi:hypothetical protein